MSERPDVEKIISEIREAGEEGNPPEADSTQVAAAERDGDLDQLLTHANALFAENAAHRGFKGLLHRLAVKVLEPEFSVMRRYNECSVRILNKLSKMLTGNDTAATGDLVAQVSRRIDLLTDLGQRLDRLERESADKVGELEARVAELEKGREAE